MRAQHCRSSTNENAGYLSGQGYSGVWQVSFAIRSAQYSGETNQAWLYINGEQIEESVHWTYYDGSGGHVSTLSSRTLYMRLEAGDKISLRTGKVGYGLHHITLCFQLAQVDYGPPM